MNNNVMTETKSTEMDVVISARNNKDGFAVEGLQTSPAPVKNSFPIKFSFPQRGLSTWVHMSS